MSDFATDFNDLTRRVEMGELGTSNLIDMLLVEREKNAVLALALKESRVLYNELVASTPYAFTITDNEELVELILWLALPWGDNDPLFPEGDGWTPRALEANSRMKRTWQRVVRSSGAVPVEEGNTNGNI